MADKSTWKDVTKLNSSELSKSYKFFLDIANKKDDVKIDPYMLWAYITELSFLDVSIYIEIEPLSKPFPFVFELTAKGKDEFFKAVSNPGTSLLSEFVDKLFLGLPSGKKNISIYKHTSFVSAFISLDDLQSTFKNPKARECFSRIELGLPIYAPGAGFGPKYLDSPDFLTSLGSLIKAGFQETDNSPKLEADSAESNSAHAIVGVIDDGFAFLNHQFQNNTPKPCRIHALWDQNNPAHNDAPYGVFRKCDIDKLIDECRKSSLSYAMHEEQIYKAYNLPRLIKAVSHGTHVMSIAAGADPELIGATDKREIIAVVLRQSQLRFSDTSGRSLAPFVIDALLFLLDEANTIAKSASTSRSVVINLSYGPLAGPHNGSSMLESAIDAIIADKSAFPYLSEVTVNIAAGNQRLARCTASFELKGRKSVALQWKILPDDQTPNFLEIWFPEGFELHNVSITVKSPLGAEITIRPKDIIEQWALLKTSNGLETTSATVQTIPESRNAAGNRPLVLISTAPTRAANQNTLEGRAASTAKPGVAPAGIWEIRLQGVCDTVDTMVEAWIQRDDTLDRNPTTGRQSYFDDPAYKRFNSKGYPKATEQAGHESYVTVRNSMNSIATGGETVSIGAYRLKDKSASRYSGLGSRSQPPPQVDEKGGEPYIYGVGDDSEVFKGVLAAGTRSGSTFALRGTSMAAAHATRHIASGKKLPSPKTLEFLPLSDSEKKKKSRRILLPPDP